jgi:hypothetical protein
MVRVVSALQSLFPLTLGCMVGCAAMAAVDVVHARRSTPSIFLTQPSNGSSISGTVTLLAVASDEGFAGMNFQVNGASLGSEITSGSCSRAWDTTQMADGSYSVAAVARTDDGLLAASAPAVVTIENNAPGIFDIKAWNITETSASITWYTLLPADAQMDFGTTGAYGRQTPLQADLSTMHTLVLSDLTPGTTYHFRVYSQNALGRRSVSADQLFSTPGSQPSGQDPAPNSPSLPPKAEPPFTISNLNVRVKATTAIITWTTDQPGDTEYRYGPGRIRGGMVTTDGALVTNHSVILTDLMPGVDYVYQVQARTGEGRTTTSDALKFTTAR